MARAELLVLALLAVPFSLRAQSYSIPPVKAAIALGSQRIQIAASGTISAGPANAPALDLNIDLGDLQRQMTQVLAAELNRSDNCGERLTVESAALAPAAPAALLTAKINYQRYACAKAFGREIVKKLVGGLGVIQLKVTPQVADNNISVDSEVQKIDADGSLGKLLHSGDFAGSLKQDIGDSLESAIQNLADTKATLPPAIQSAVTLRTIRFARGGSGRLSLELTGDVRLPGDQLRRAVGQ